MLEHTWWRLFQELFDHTKSDIYIFISFHCLFQVDCFSAGADPGGGGVPRHAPPPPKIGKNMIFWRKIVIFHMKYPKKNLSVAPPNLKSLIRPCSGVMVRIVLATSTIIINQWFNPRLGQTKNYKIVISWFSAKQVTLYNGNSKNQLACRSVLMMSTSKTLFGPVNFPVFLRTV